MVLLCELRSFFVIYSIDSDDRGVFVYIVFNGIIGLIVFFFVGYFEFCEYDFKEYWIWKGFG